MSVLMVTYSRRIDAQHLALSDARSELSSWLLGGDQQIVGRERAEDVGLIVTELSANAIDHTKSPWVWVEVVVSDHDVTIDVTNLGSADTVPDVASWGLLESGERGRGLRIVRSLCKDIDVTRGTGTTQIRCRVPLE